MPIIKSQLDETDAHLVDLLPNDDALLLGWRGPSASPSRR
jgi:hypothetical protein